MNKILGLFVTLISFVLAFIGDVQAQSTIVEQGGIGSCGTGCSWTLYSNGKLEVTGTGENAEIEYKSHSGSGTNQPWGKYKNQVSFVDISGISNISAGAFRAMGAVEQINIDESTTTIGYSALSTYSHAKIFIPDSVTTFSPTGGHDIFTSQATIYCSTNNKNSCRSYTFFVENNPVNIHEYTKNPDGSYSLIENNREVEKFASLRDFQNGNSFEKYGYDKSGKQYLLSNDGQLFLKNSDGSSYYFNEDGELTSIQGKRIYTVDEATFMTSKGNNKNTFSIRYR